MSVVFQSKKKRKPLLYLDAIITLLPALTRSSRFPKLSSKNSMTKSLLLSIILLCGTTFHFLSRHQSDTQGGKLCSHDETRTPSLGWYVDWTN